MKHLLTICAILACLAAPAATKPDSGEILEDFQLTGELTGGHAVFTLNALARVTESRGGSLELLRGAVGLIHFNANPRWRLEARRVEFEVLFDRGGKFPVQLKFNAAVRQRERLELGRFPGRPQRAAAHAAGTGADTQFEFAGAARPECGSDFVSYLPADGAVKLSWKEARPESRGQTFYAAEMLSQISVSPGLMRQMALLDFKVMQGELNRVTLLLRGAGEVTRVQGEQVLAWNVEPAPNASSRRLVVQFNQPQKDQFASRSRCRRPWALSRRRPMRCSCGPRARRASPVISAS